MCPSVCLDEIEYLYYVFRNLCDPNEPAVTTVSPQKEKDGFVFVSETEAEIKIDFERVCDQRCTLFMWYLTVSVLAHGDFPAHNDSHHEEVRAYCVRIMIFMSKSHQLRSYLKEICQRVQIRRPTKSFLLFLRQIAVLVYK